MCNLASLAVHVDDELITKTGAMVTLPHEGDWENGWQAAVYRLIHATAEVELALPEGEDHMFSVTGITGTADLFCDTAYDADGEFLHIEMIIQTIDTGVQLTSVRYADFDAINSPSHLPWRRDITTGEQLFRAVIEDLTRQLRDVRASFAC
ncbi:hypothetical protein [Nocardia sp. NPDC127526]|uniref:hypothetical protein n=1 Tax=Nocardia sp. NPDC127526 TaxID=3345393 RepID=UPI0036271DB1